MIWTDFVGWAEKFILDFSYIGILVVSIIGTSTLFMPFPFDTIVIFAASGLGLSPILVGVSAGLGAAIGELTGYFVGVGGRFVMGEKKTKFKFIDKMITLFTDRFKKYGIWIVPVFAFLPFPFDLVGILCGMAKFDIKKFFAATLVGRVARCILIAYLGSFVIPFFTQWLLSL
jgi:membrane protein DedA with SNARE-associated domain